MGDGCVSLCLAFKCWKHYKRPSVRMVFEDLLLSADWAEDGTGYVVTTAAAIQRSTGLSKPTVSRVLRFLCESGEISKGTINGMGAIRINASELFHNGQNFLPQGQIILPEGQKFLPQGKIILPQGQNFLPSNPKEEKEEKESFPPHPL